MVDEVHAHVLEELGKATLVTYHSVDEVDANTPDEKRCDGLSSVAQYDDFPKSHWRVV